VFVAPLTGQLSIVFGASDGDHQRITLTDIRISCQYVAAHAISEWKDRIFAIYYTFSIQRKAMLTTSVTSRKQSIFIDRINFVEIGRC
jgi:hypothetical protein